MAPTEIGKWWPIIRSASIRAIDPDPGAMAKTDVQYDVIVIGAGIAGLVAANRAAQLGKRVIVLAS